MPPKSTPVYCAAVDLGATSGRVMVGTWAKNRLELREVHRFPNGVRQVGDNAYWDIPGLWEQVQQGLELAAQSLPEGEELASVGVDTWGVDYVLVDESGRAVYPTHAYRDNRTQAGLKALTDDPTALRKIYRTTGIPAIFLNSSLQLAETVATHPAITTTAKRCLFLPDYFNFLLSGKLTHGQSIAGTAQLLNVKTGGWSRSALKHFGLPAGWFSRPLTSGTKLGRVRNIPALKRTRVISVPGHDTTCAYDAIPAAADGSDILISSGTWSLVGMENDRPLLSDDAIAARVANDQTGRGDYRPLVNVIGLWLLEETLQDFKSRPSKASEWTKLINAARALPTSEQLLDVTDPVFGNPASMRQAIDAQLKRRRIKPPVDLPAYVRLICDSLGQGHADVVANLAKLSGRTFKRIIMVGGGSQNALLCQATADAAQLPVMSCQLEGSAVGNMANQLIALGSVKCLAEFRRHLTKQLTTKIYRAR
ncbi:MAG: rhamnulokinase [Opitutaceae bacterium]|mgnify:CR=1 FL=1|jgi:rhamnulokinase|nr:rhamnulokinase [Opitutaceae bacterium]